MFLAKRKLAIHDQVQAKSRTKRQKRSRDRRGKKTSTGMMEALRNEKRDVGEVI